MQDSIIIPHLFLPFSVFRLNNFCTTGSKSSLAVLVDGQVRWTKSGKREHKLIPITNTQINNIYNFYKAQQAFRNHNSSQNHFL